MKYIFILFTLPFLFSCEEEVIITPNDDKPVIVETLEQKIAHHVEATLEIPATEKYTIDTYSAQMNTDDSLDMIITVNLLDRAMTKALKSNNLATRVEAGYMGRYNFFFFYDGATKKISKEIPVPSSGIAELKVDFEHIRTEAYNDILITYKLENASFTRFFTILNNLPKETFEVMNYEGLGDRESKAYCVKYSEGTFSLAKDINVYQAKLEKIKFEDPKKVFNYEPTIEETDVLDRKWFFNDNDLKYYTLKDE